MEFVQIRASLIEHGACKSGHKWADGGFVYGCEACEVCRIAIDPLPLADDALRVSPSTEELRTIATLLDHERLAGQAMITQRDGSWLELAVVVSEHGVARDQAHALGRAPMLPVMPPEPGVYKYAIWRYTCLPYRVGPDGAVEDDPLWGTP